MVFSIKKFRHYLLLNLVVFFVDYIVIMYLMNKVELSIRLARWVLLLKEFDHIVEYKLKNMHKQTSHLSRLSKLISEVSIDNTLVDES